MTEQRFTAKEMLRLVQDDHARLVSERAALRERCEALEQERDRLSITVALFEGFQAAVDRAAQHGNIPEPISDLSDSLDITPAAPGQQA